MKFRPDIEGMRAVAVLLVVLYHADVPGFSGGFAGVDVFFVLSGYLITGLLVLEYERRGSIDLLEFYGRRIRRLLPAVGVVALATVAVGALILAPHEQRTVADTALATAGYVSNLYFILESADYFRLGPQSNPLLHTWSLAVEEQFYAVWPLLVLLSLRVFSRRGLVLVLATASLGSLALCTWLTSYRLPWAFFLSPTRAWEFGLGALVWLLPRTYRHAAGTGLIGLLASNLLLSPTTAFPGLYALLPTVSTALVLAGDQRGLTHRLLSAPWLQWLGRRSYSWYLWHWPVVVYAEILGATAWTVALVAGLSLVPAHLSYVLVENPVRFHPRLRAAAGPSLALGVGLTMVGVLAALGGRQVAILSAASVEQQSYLEARAADHGPPTCGSGWWETEVRPCVFGRGPVRVAMLGDSHIAQWIPAARRLAEARGWQISVFYKSNCPAADVSVWVMSMRRVEWECDMWRAAALDAIREMRPALVVATSAGMAYLSERTTVAEWESGLRRTFENLRPHPVLYLRDTPRPGFDVPTCLGRSALPLRAPRSCDADARVALGQVDFEAVRRAAEGLTHVRLADFSEHFLCDETCPAVIDGVVVYRDGSHLSARFAGLLSPVLGEVIARELRAVATDGQ